MGKMTLKTIKVLCPGKTEKVDIALATWADLQRESVKHKRLSNAV